MSEQLTEVEKHNAYSWIKPDAAQCYLCGRKAFATPVDGFQVSDCDKCERPVCQECAEVDYDGDSEGFRNTQWECLSECLVDIRVPVTVTFDFSIHKVNPDEVEATIRQLLDVVAGANLESRIADEFEDGDDPALASGTRWTPAEADMDNVGIRTHARSGGFSPWKPGPESATFRTCNGGDCSLIG